MTGTPSLPGDGSIRADAQATHWGHSDWNFWDNDYKELLKIVRSMKPDRVADAGTAYQDMADRMKTSIEVISKQAGALSEHWGGTNADAAWKKMQKMYDASREIYDKTGQTASALTAHAGMQRSWQSSLHDEHWYGVEIGTGGTNFGDWLGGDSSMGRQLMQKLQDQTVDSNKNFPADLQADMPTLGKYQDYNPYNGNGPGPFGGGPTGGGGPLPNGGHLPNGGKFPNGGDLSKLHYPNNHYPNIHDPNLHNPNLHNPNLHDPNLHNLTGGHLGSGAGGTGLAGVHPGQLGGLGTGGAGAGNLGAAGIGPGSGVAGAGVGNGLAAGEAGLAGMAGRGGMMPPMHPAHGGGEKNERERTTWGAEDEDVWVSDIEAAPPVIGDPGHHHGRH